MALSGIQVSPASFDFGNVNINTTSAVQQFTIINIGVTDLIIGIITLSGINFDQFRILTDFASGVTIAPGQNEAVDLVFEPTSLGVKNVNLNIPSSDLVTPMVVVPLTGTGVTGLSEPVFSIKPTSYNFGSVAVGDSATTTFTITNLGIANLYIYDAEITGIDAAYFSVSDGDCLQQYIFPGQSCTLEVTFAPKKKCTRSANLTITTNDPVYPVATVKLKGRGFLLLT